MRSSPREESSYQRHPIFDPRRPLWFLLHLVIMLVGVSCALVGNAWLQAVGASLVAAGIAGFVVYVYVARSERIERGLDILNRFGVHAVFPARSVRIRSEYDERCRRMREHLDILGFGLSHLLEDHRDDFADWKRRANVRILAIDPDFPSSEFAYAQQRDLEENSQGGRIRQDVVNLYQALKPLIGSDGGKTFEMKLYRCLPSINIFRIDDVVLWGPYFMYQASRNTPTFLITQDGLLFDRIMGHFEAIWKDPKLSVPPTALEQTVAEED